MKNVFLTDTCPEEDLQCTLKTHVLSVLSAIGKFMIYVDGIKKNLKMNGDIL